VARLERRALALGIGLALSAHPAAAFYCDPGGALVVNHALTGTASATTGAATAALAIDGDALTAWQGATSGSSVFVWEAPADVFAERIHFSVFLGSPVLVELLDASDAVLASGSVGLLAGSPQIGIFDTQGRLLRKVRLTVTPGTFAGFPVTRILELRIESAGTPPAPTLPGPGPEELTPVATFQGVGDAPGGGFFSRAHAVSPDGRLVTGETERDSGRVAAFRFADGALVPLGFTAEFRDTDLTQLREVCRASSSCCTWSRTWPTPIDRSTGRWSATTRS